MYDAGKIIIGLVIFLTLITFPLWYNIARGTSGDRPEPVILTPEKNCVEDADYMRDSHMELLNKWRDDVVRDGNRIHVAPDGTKYMKSLQRTCMDCHSNKDQFCDKCHDYSGITPYCWDCHIEPEGGGK